MLKRISTYKLWWLSIPFLFIPPLLHHYPTFDIQLHDTYLVMGKVDLSITLSIIFLLFSLVYWALRNFKMIKVLSFLHFLITVIASISLLFGILLNSHNHLSNPESYRRSFIATSGLISILVFVQPVFIINVIIGVLRGKRLNNSF